MRRVIMMACGLVLCAANAWPQNLLRRPGFGASQQPTSSAGASQEPSSGSGAGQPPAPGRGVIREIESTIKKAVGQRPLGQGIVLDWVAIADIQVPKKAQKALEALWTQPIQSEQRLQEAETKLLETIAESKGKAASITNVEKARREAERAAELALENRREGLGRSITDCFTRIVWTDKEVRPDEFLGPGEYKTWRSGERIPEGELFGDTD